MAEHTPGYVAALAAAEHHHYIHQLTRQLEQASQFRIPCPGHPQGHYADLYVTRRNDGRADGWAICRDNFLGDVWNGTAWTARNRLSRDDIYRYTRDQALTEATRIAPLQTAGFNAYIARLRAETKEEPTT